MPNERIYHSVENGTFYEESRKVQSGLQTKASDGYKRVLDLELHKVREDQWETIYDWIEMSLSSKEPFDGSPGNRSLKRLYVIAEFKSIEPKGFCSVTKTREDRYTARKIGSIFSYGGVGDKTEMGWPEIKSELQKEMDFGYKEDLFSGLDSSGKEWLGKLTLWRRGDDLHINASSREYGGGISGIAKLLGGLDSKLLAYF